MKIWISSKFGDDDHAKKALELGDVIISKGHDPDKCSVNSPDRKVMVDNALTKLKTCDILFLCNDYATSPEAQLEYAYAKQVGMAVYVETTRTWENLPF